MMYPLVLCSRVAMGVSSAKGWTLWLANRGSKKILADVEEAARAGRIDEAIQITTEKAGPTAAILLSGLRRIRLGSVNEGELPRAVSTTGAIELGEVDPLPGTEQE